MKRAQIYSCFIARDTWRCMSAGLNKEQFSSKVVKPCLWSRIAQKPTVQPIMNFSQFICCGESHLEPKLKKKSVRQILSYFWFHVLVCKKTVLQIFMLLIWMLNQTQFLNSAILRWGHTGRFWEKRDLTYWCPVCHCVLGRLFWPFVDAQLFKYHIEWQKT